MRPELFAVIPSFTAQGGHPAANDPMASGAAAPTHWYGLNTQNNSLIIIVLKCVSPHHHTLEQLTKVWVSSCVNLENNKCCTNTTIFFWFRASAVQTVSTAVSTDTPAIPPPWHAEVSPLEQGNWQNRPRTCFYFVCCDFTVYWGVYSFVFYIIHFGLKCITALIDNNKEKDLRSVQLYIVVVSKRDVTFYF